MAGCRRVAVAKKTNMHDRAGKDKTWRAEVYRMGQQKEGKGWVSVVVIDQTLTSVQYFNRYVFELVVPKAFET